ncbi:hypothetical protein, partial [Mesorhizobium sp.]
MDIAFTLLMIVSIDAYPWAPSANRDLRKLILIACIRHSHYASTLLESLRMLEQPPYGGNDM